MIRSPTRPWILLGLILACILPLSGAAACRGTNPVATAATADPAYRPETVAFALFSSYVVLDNQALELVKDTLTPPQVQHALIQAHNAAAPLVRQLPGAAKAYAQVREEVAHGSSTREKLQLALDALNRIIAQAAPRVDSLARVIGGAS